MRTPPKKRNASGAESRGVSKKIKLQCGLPENTNPTRPDLQVLETMAEWKENLDARFKRAWLRYGLVGMDSAELRALNSEGQAWKQVCRALLYEEGDEAA
jgi:hypothetical protein